MNICVFGAASNEIDAEYISVVEDMAEKLALAGHNLVFGAGAHGLMGAAARGFKKGGAFITGVIPNFFKETDIEIIYNDCDELIFTDTMRERKAEMENKADAFIIVPGGIGTFEELFEVLTLKQLGRHKKPIIIYNINGYYSDLKSMIDNGVKQNFINSNFNSLYNYCSRFDEILHSLTSPDTPDLSVKDLKY